MAKKTIRKKDTPAHMGFQPLVEKVGDQQSYVKSQSMPSRRRADSRRDLRSAPSQSSQSAQTAEGSNETARVSCPQIALAISPRKPFGSPSPSSAAWTKPTPKKYLAEYRAIGYATCCGLTCSQGSLTDELTPKVEQVFDRGTLSSRVEESGNEQSRQANPAQNDYRPCGHKSAQPLFGVAGAQ